MTGVSCDCCFTCYAIIIALLIVVLGYVLYDVVANVSIPNLTGKHIVVTGGSSGIGKSVALEAANHGAHVTIIARDQNKLNDVLKEIREKCIHPEEQKINALSMDVTQPYDRTESMLTELEDNIGQVYMLVNCAGMAKCATIENDSEENFRRMLDLNFLGSVLPTKALAKNMCRRGEGIIVITSSMASMLGIYGMGAYCASKWALRGFAETLYHELAPHNVSVTLCLPPDTNTPGLETENIGKPEETKLICESGGLSEPVDVARKLLSDALKKRFWSTVGLEGILVTAGSAGLSPATSISETILQVAVASLFRVIALFNLQKVKTIVSKVQAERKIKLAAKKAE